MIDIENYLASKKKQIDNYINSILNEYTMTSEELKTAIEYVFFTGGKRLRPILCLAASEAVGGEDNFIMPAACSIELIHNYSLIHDDLPCMDNDDYRRGYLTCHRKFNEPTALLAGDGLLTMAFEILAKNYTSTPDVVLQVISEIASAGGINGMVGGQSLDLSDKVYTIEELLNIHSMKTGALIRVSVRTGVLLSGRAGILLQNLTNYAEKLGLAFQIMDDILDRDDSDNKKSFLSFYSIEEAKEKVCKLTEEAIGYLSDLGEKGLLLKEIALYLSRRNF